MCGDFIYIYIYQFLDLNPAEHKVKVISKGDSAFLPCTIYTSNNVYPKPDSIEWWKDNNQIEHGVSYNVASYNIEAAYIALHSINIIKQFGTYSWLCNNICIVSTLLGFITVD